MRGEWWVMTRSVSRSALLTKFQNVSEETETVVSLEGVCCESRSHSEWGLMYRSRCCGTVIKTNKHLQPMPQWERLCGFQSSMIGVAAETEWSQKELCSLASGVTEWNFYDVSQIILWDWWAEPECQLISPSTDRMRRRCPPAQLFFLRTEHPTRHGEDDYQGAPRQTPPTSACTCHQNQTTGHYFQKSQQIWPPILW